MSVINTMLRNLDARGAGPATGDVAAALGKSGPTRSPASAEASWSEPAPPAAPRTRGSRLTLIGLAGGAAIVLVGLGDLEPLMRKALGGGTATAPQPVAMAGAAAPAGLTAVTAVAAAASAGLAGSPPAPSVDVPAQPATIAPMATGPSPAPRARDGVAAARVAPAPVAGPSTASSTASSTGQTARSEAPRSGTPSGTPPGGTSAAPRPADADLIPPTPARIAKRVLPLGPEQRLAQWHARAVEQAQAGQRQAAIQTAREILAEQPRHHATRQLAAQLELETGTAGAPDRAAALLREGLALEDRNPALALPLARLLASQGLADEALEVLERHQVQGAQSDGLRGGMLARRGDFAGALPAYEAAARAQPLNSMWWLGLGVALESLGEATRARQAFIKAQAIGLPREDLAVYVDQRLRALD